MLALGLENFRICINNRLLLNGVLEQFGIADKAVPILRSLDKLPKIKRDATRQEMINQAGVSAEQADKVLALAETQGTNVQKLDQVEKNFGGNAQTTMGITRLRQLLDAGAKAGVPEDRVLIDLSICRGLDYYTGTIYETFLTDLPGYGSVCSGGRYDNLAELYTKQQLPGVGASLGLDRLLAALEELKLLKSTATPAPVFIVQFTADRIGEYQQMARRLRAAGIGAEVFPDAKKLGPQFQYAERRGFKVALIAGPDDFAKGTWNVKDLAKREEKKGVPDADVLATVRTLLPV
jgi:histidyl-tRNA synthetase